LQRIRKGDNVPAPLNLQVLGEPPTISEHRILIHNWQRGPRVLHDWMGSAAVARG
jgi:hypothetical protein